MDKVNYFLKALVLAFMIRCTMNYLLPSPEKLLFRFLDGLTFGVLLWFLIFWFIGFFKKYSKGFRDSLSIKQLE